MSELRSCGCARAAGVMPRARSACSRASARVILVFGGLRWGAECLACGGVLPRRILGPQRQRLQSNRTRARRRPGQPLPAQRRPARRPRFNLGRAFEAAPPALVSGAHVPSIAGAGGQRPEFKRSEAGGLIRAAPPGGPPPLSVARGCTAWHHPGWSPARSPTVGRPSTARPFCRDSGWGGQPEAKARPRPIVPGVRAGIWPGANPIPAQAWDELNRPNVFGRI